MSLLNWLIFFLEIFSTYSFDLSNQTNECVTWMSKHLVQSIELHMSSDSLEMFYVYFENFSQLQEINCTQFLINTQDVYLFAERRIFIESNFDLTQLVSFFKTESIILKNIKGFSQETNIEKIDFHYDFEIFIEMVNFEFYLNKTLITREMCNYENFIDLNDYFVYMQKLFFSYDVSYTQSICPFVFLNSKLEHLGLFHITNS